ncbi:unnamed protein product [Prorocentrum cordatum]|uniref:Cytochrome b5 heme-binding domain-containing protein n=1 Tax=Prorocentrum cordatum TaxID=2364126 RepID=A0ABN9V828_9DINO|nr:unnamed protein product [Polarella glacialis]
MQATFGPTRASLQELSQTTMQSWIRAQMQAPIGSHREYWRKRVNSRFVDYPDVGSPRSRCAVGSRWHSFAFAIVDKGKWVSITGNKIYVDGVHRSDIDPGYSGNGLPPPVNCTDEPTASWSRQGRPCSGEKLVNLCNKGTSGWLTNKYCQQSCFDQRVGYDGDDCSAGWASLEDAGYLCVVTEKPGGLVTLSTSASCDVHRVYSNPSIWFSSPPGDSGANLTFQELRPGVVTLAQGHGGEPCDLGQFVYHGGQPYLADARLELLQNDLASPSGGENVCRAVPSPVRTFLNEGSCQLRTACGAVEVGGVSPPSSFVLDAATFELFLNRSERYVYAVAGLVDDSSPCGRRSRWRPLDCSSEDCSATALGAAEAAAFSSALAREAGSLRDVYVSCEGVAAGAVVASGGDYFVHVHSNYHNVYDFTHWVSAHPGGTEPITRWATGSFELEFPSWHPMGRWATAQTSLDYVGKLGDTVSFEALPVALQAAWTVGYESCGSPGEVANDPSLGHQSWFSVEFRGIEKDDDFEVPYSRANHRQSKSTVWTTMALYASDQLRQRAAWALSQIMVTSSNGIGSSFGQTEFWVTYYDIFVRNAFGNYRDVLREVTYSPVMGSYLSFKGSKSQDSSAAFPDENYAREIMQLFDRFVHSACTKSVIVAMLQLALFVERDPRVAAPTRARGCHAKLSLGAIRCAHAWAGEFTIGLWELNQDGTRKTDADGNDVSTYDNGNITSFARVFTGFSAQAKRPNIEDFTSNMVDPMQMMADWHDVYPKPDLSGGYLGDGYPLCADLPPRAFLLRGARYRFVGYAYTGGDLLVLNSSSALYAALSQVQLNVELNSTIGCFAEECYVHSLRVVQVAEGRRLTNTSRRLACTSTSITARSAPLASTRDSPTKTIARAWTPRYRLPACPAARAAPTTPTLG